VPPGGREQRRGEEVRHLERRGRKEQRESGREGRYGPEGRHKARGVDVQAGTPERSLLKKRDRPNERLGDMGQTEEKKQPGEEKKPQVRENERPGGRRKREEKNPAAGVRETAFFGKWDGGKKKREKVRGKKSRAQEGLGM